jgi:hypothetical protein
MLRSLVILLTCLLFTAQSKHACAAERVVVFYLNEHHRPVTRLDRLPELTPGLKALLALYALENGAGCEGKDESDRVRCDMTEKLGLGSNCSDAHIQLVRTWFDSTPNLTSRWSARWNTKTRTPGTLENLCYGQPDTASWHNIWEIIKVKSTGDAVEVEAILSWGSQHGHGRVRYINSYRIGSQTIAETASQVTELSRSKEGIFGGGTR